jgi:hypothetical protein
MTENTQHEFPLEEESAPDAQEEIPAESEVTADTITVETLYGDDAQVAALAERVMMVAPWAHYKLSGEWQQMTKKEVSLVIRRCMALGVDPLNDKEVHIWRGKHGVNFQLAYTLMAQWVRNMKGGHTEPRFTDLRPDEKDLHGLSENDQATRASLVMLSDIPNIIALSQAGFSPEEARAHLTVTDLGTVRAEDWASPYFAPSGRSKGRPVFCAANAERPAVARGFRRDGPPAAGGPHQPRSRARPDTHAAGRPNRPGSRQDAGEGPPGSPRRSRRPDRNLGPMRPASGFVTGPRQPCNTTRPWTSAPTRPRMTLHAALSVRPRTVLRPGHVRRPQAFGIVAGVQQLTVHGGGHYAVPGPVAIVQTEMQVIERRIARIVNVAQHLALGCPLPLVDRDLVRTLQVAVEGLIFERLDSLIQCVAIAKDCGDLGREYSKHGFLRAVRGMENTHIVALACSRLPVAVLPFNIPD